MPGPTSPPSISWPEGRKFAFSIFDDTDRATLENNQAIYGFLKDLGFRTTKTVWMFDGRNPPVIPGVTCTDGPYRDWLIQLQKDGFEIAWHNATWETSEREVTLQGLEDFERTFGHPPLTMANHASNGEGIYWGNARLTGPAAALYGLLQRGQKFTGHLKGHPNFWGDLCKSRIRYVRNFTFETINTLQNCPFMPYHDPLKPWVSAWFAGSEGADCQAFNRMLCESNQDRLEAEGGMCILYTHFGKGFHDRKGLNPRFVELMQRLAAKGGWYVPVSDLLDHLAQRNGGIHELTDRERRQMERSWMSGQLARVLHR